ncbi:MAG TPA: NfeD family protein [Polyangia bacterium]
MELAARAGVAGQPIMLSLYIGSLIFGGVLLGSSLLGGGDDGHGHDVGPDTGHGGGHDAHGADGEHGPAAVLHPTPGARSHRGARLPIFSLGFWSFSTAFFGLTGLALTLAGGLGALIPVVAGAVGLGSGLISSRVLSQLTGKTVGLLGDANSHVGREGRLLLPVEPGRRGKIRLSVGGVSTDLIAETEANQALPAGSTVLVVGLRDNIAIVEANPAAPLEANPATPLLKGVNSNKSEPS